MHLGRKIISFFIALFLIVSFLTCSVWAADEFATSYQITYIVNRDASVLVQQNISLENKLANIYATEYQVNLGATRVSGVTAWDEKGNISPLLETHSNSTSVNLRFNQKIVGKGEKTNFGLSFLTADFTSLDGQVLQVSIPKLTDSQSLTNYQVILKIPSSFGKPIFISPEPQNTQELNDFNIYSFVQSQLINQSIFASFGEKQFMDFKLNYNLDNPYPDARLFEISLPPETSWQKITLNTLEPQPENVRVDADGNWLAEYLLKGQEKLEILATGSATLYLAPSKIRPASNKDLSSLLKAQEYWPTQNEEIKNLAGQLQTAQKIYDYVVKNLSYDYDKVKGEPKRLGAIQALADPQKAVCMEFTDLFVALCRTAGIPAREINGYAYSQNPQLRPANQKAQILHSWPEYFDQEKKLWIAVDPTWEKTSGLDFFNHFDLSHLTLVIHGQDSQYPVPADQIKVIFGLPALEQEKFSLEIKSPAKALAGFNIKIIARIKNNGNVTLTDSRYGLIPPFGHYDQEINLTKTSIFSHGLKLFNFQVAGEQKQVAINIVSPLIAWALPLVLILTFAFAFFMLFLKAAKKVHPPAGGEKRSQL